MKPVFNKYKAVIGLEVHIQLLTRGKIFSTDKNEFGAPPNTHVSVVSLGHPGTLPRLNKKVTEHAIKLGLACRSKITARNEFSRKNYFYADLPKGYQITQFATPICTGGYVEIKIPGSQHTRQIPLTRIHIEEDAGKSIHDQHPFESLVDLNRAGVPLLEMVTEPEIRSAEEAFQFLSEVRKLVRYLEICDGNMEEGSLRCDANISMMPEGAKKFGNKVEVKNLNSIRNVQRAIQFEIKRQVELLESGGEVAADTRSFEAGTGTTFSLRSKELTHDYRYFPEPDLLPVPVTAEYINEIKNQLPPLPDELFRKFMAEYGLSAYDAGVITEDKGIALYYEEMVRELENLCGPEQSTGSADSKGTAGNKSIKQELYKSAANWLMGTVKSFLNEQGTAISKFNVGPEKMARLILLIDDGKVSNSIASQKIFPFMIAHPEKFPEQIAKENNLLQQRDEPALIEFVKQATAKYPEKAAEYKAGKKGLIGFFMGEVMKLSKGKADPKLANQLVKKMLENGL